MNEEELNKEISDLEEEINKLKSIIETDYVPKEKIKKAINKLKVKRKIAIEEKRINAANCLLFEIKHLEKFL